MPTIEFGHLNREARAFWLIFCLNGHNLNLSEEFIRSEIERLGLLRMSDHDFENFLAQARAQSCNHTNLRIKASYLLAAVQDQTPGIVYFLDVETGQILRDSYAKEVAADNELQRKLEAEPDRYLYLEPLTEADIEWIRRDFVKSLSPGMKEKFDQAIENCGPAASFEEAAASDPAICRRWRKFYKKNCRKHILELLETGGVVADIV